jgi:polysaccharide chain length determinant protein (PEP-CTERM system associated)
MTPSTLPAPRTSAQARKAEELQPDELLLILYKEARKRIVAIAGTFAAVTLLTLVVGMLIIPRNYTASTTILAQDSDIIQPLLEGRAVPTGVADRAGHARQIAYSRRVLEQVLEVGGWSARNPGPIERDRLMEDIRNATMITSPRPDLVQIDYRDTDPERAFRVTEAFGSLFIEETLAAKARESREAYEFIDKQVQEYHAKLLEAEKNLQDYRSRNADAQPGSAVDVNTRISSLRTQVEQARMALLEQESREGAIASQLSGESAVYAVQTRENLYRTQMIELRAELDRLLLTYTERHPDVVRIRHQLEDLQRSLAAEQARRGQAGQTALSSEEAQLNPLYNELRSQQAQARREAAATRSRMGIAQSLLNEELDRSRRIAASESALAELTRDYEVNREIYQDLLRRRENARVSMGLDQENRGLTLRIQDPATMPLRPSGLRFMHIAAAGFALAVALPLGLLFLLVRFDPRVRAPRQIVQKTGYPLLTVIPAYPTPRERRRQTLKLAMSAAMVCGVFVVYGLLFAFKLTAA